MQPPDQSTMSHTGSEDGILYVSQPRLIGLQRDAQLLSQKAGLVRSQLSGNYISSFKGRGMEFDEARPYQPGDDIRSMDWRVTARTNKPHSKVFREERERPVLLWVDFTASMFFGTRRCLKSVQAAKMASILAWSSSQKGDRLGCLLFSEQTHFELRPGRGKAATLHVIKQLSEFSRLSEQAPHASHLAQASADHALKRLQQVTRPGSLIYLISDFRFDKEPLKLAINRLALHNELVLIHVIDPLESDLPKSGRYRVSDGENETEINTSNVSLKQRYHQNYVNHREQLQQLSLRPGVRYVYVSTGQGALEGLMSVSARDKKRVSGQL